MRLARATACWSAASPLPLWIRSVNGTSSFHCGLRRAFGIWNLELRWSLELGAWSLSWLPPSPLFGFIRILFSGGVLDVGGIEKQGAKFVNGFAGSGAFNHDLDIVQAVDGGAGDGLRPLVLGKVVTALALFDAAS